MSDSHQEINRVWGGIGGGTFTREAALKKHLEESEQSRKRQEAEASQARHAAEGARREAEEQTRILAQQAHQQEEMAEEARRQAEALAYEDHQTRAIPDALFFLSQQRASMAAFCKSTLAAKKTLSEAEVENALGTIEVFSSKLFGLSSEYLQNFTHKRLLSELRSEFQPLVDAVKELRLTKQAERLSEMEPTIRGFCRELIQSPEKLSRDDIIRKREAIRTFWYELARVLPSGGNRVLNKMRAGFERLIGDVNAATAWQVKCDEPNADAKAEQTFAPLLQFTPKQLNDYLGAVDQAIVLEKKAHPFERFTQYLIVVFSGYIALAWCFWITLYLIESKPEWRQPYVYYVPIALFFAGLYFCKIVAGAFASRCYQKAQDLYNRISQTFPGADPQHLRHLRAAAGVEGNSWVVPNEMWSKMLNLSAWKI